MHVTITRPGDTVAGREGTMIEALQRWAAKRGCAIAWGPMEVVREAQEEIASRRKAGELDDGFFLSELTSVADSPGISDGGTVVMVAWPVPAHTIVFDLGDERFEAVLPPTYVRYRARFEDIHLDLARHGLPGARIEYLAGPLKATAARLGLIRYGRNNIGYAAGLGSYVQLCGFITDASLPVREPALPGPRLLGQCESCSACRSACPTGAISEDRVLLRAEKCLTLANENPGEWPAWLPSNAHNCLLGCLLCQTVCPANPALLVELTGLHFSPAETRWLMESGGETNPRAESGFRAKLAWLGQPYAEPVIGRNLQALVASRRGRIAAFRGRIRLSDHVTAPSGSLPADRSDHGGNETIGDDARPRSRDGRGWKIGIIT